MNDNVKFNLRVVLSGKCNYKCNFCSLDFNNANDAKNTDMKPDFLLDCIASFGHLGGKKVGYTGGEPLMYPGLKPALEFSKSFGMTNAVTTNGSLLGIQEPHVLNIIDEFHVSMPAFSQDEYIAVTSSQGVSLDDILTNILKIRRQEKKIKINAVYLEHNIDDIRNMVAFFSNHGIVVKIMNDMLGNNDYYQRYLNYTSQWEGHEYVVIEKDLNPNLGICKNCIIKNSLKGSCPSCRSIWAYPDGRVTLCPRDLHNGIRCGDKSEVASAIKTCFENN